jgi:methylated-DNA-[protein]-cysteine S-methyltransferase
MAGLKYITTPLGRLRIEDDGEAVTLIHFENNDEVLQPEQTGKWASMAAMQLSEYFEGKRQVFDFPFQQSGTDFQQRVWNQLNLIASGITISYLELARQLKDEKCIRAAASANGKNKLAIVVPCHRVIGASGKLVGYAGGLWRKQWLLEHEAKMAGRNVQGSLF